MSTKSLLKTLAVAVAAVAMAVPAQAQKRTDINGDGRTDVDDLNMVINEMLGKSQLRYATDYLEVSNATAHYVGNCIIVDFDITNVSSIDLNNVLLRIEKLDTDGGTLLTNYNHLSTGEGQAWTQHRIENFVIDQGETRQMRLRLSDNALTVVPAKVTVKIFVNMAQLGSLDDNFLDFVVPVSDGRALTNAMWTNDDHLTYTTPVMERDGDDLWATFTVTNNTVRDLNNITMRFDLVNNGSGTTYSVYDSYFVVDGNKNSQRIEHFPIDKGETREMSIMVKDFFKTTPRALNATIVMTCDNYTFASPNLYVTSVKIPDGIK